MIPDAAWIVTDDQPFAERVESFLNAPDCRCICVPVSEWLESDAGELTTVFLDLRSGPVDSRPLWDDLQTNTERYRQLSIQSNPVIGVCSGEIPIGGMTAADRWLSGIVDWPSRADAFGRGWRAAIRVARRNTSELECREIHSDKFLFRTYTRSLFPSLERLQRAAEHDFTILIVGETGTGKTTLASLIHELSPRRNSRFLTVACGALPGDLIDSELFGHVRGAFTGADRAKDGKFQAAGDGTILLDEIDVLGTLQQAKLLRVLETGQFEPVGSNDTLQARCRTIVASNVRLETLLQSNEFRSDLYYRLNQVKFEIPPLRQRPADVVPLAAHFIEECCCEHSLEVQSIHTDMLRILKSYSWPGNIRELRNEVRRAVLFARDGQITPDALSLSILEEFQEAPKVDDDGFVAPSALAQDVAQTERESIEQMLRKQGYNRAATARALGISRVTLYNKLRKYRIDVDQMVDDVDE